MNKIIFKGLESLQIRGILVFCFILFVGLVLVFGAPVWGKMGGRRRSRTWQSPRQCGRVGSPDSWAVSDELVCRRYGRIESVVDGHSGHIGLCGTGAIWCDVSRAVELCSSS